MEYNRVQEMRLVVSFFLFFCVQPQLFWFSTLFSGVNFLLLTINKRKVYFSKKYPSGVSAVV